MSYTCFNRPPFSESLIVQDGYHDDSWITGVDPVERIARWKQSPFRMAQKCQYQADDKYNDPQCHGCKHKEVK